MLSSNLQSILENRVRYLPEITGKAIKSIDWPSKLIEIGKKYGMHVDEMEDFQGVVLKSMIGMIPPEKFEDELISTLALSPSNAEKIIEDINNSILEPIHDFVMNKGQLNPNDPLKTAGIILESDPEPEELPVPETTQPQIAVPKPPTLTSESLPVNQPLEIPSSPEQVTTKPLVSGNFNGFFINNSAQSN